MTTTETTRTEIVDVNGTTIAVDRHGEGRPLLLVHGAGEDAAMLGGQARSLADAGYEVVTYDRRGTGRSGRDAWPARSAAADQHADDAAGLIEALALEDPVVLGVSSGGVIALRLAARHPELVGRVVAWEPPMAGLLPGGAELTAQLMAPVEEHLASHPGDFVGAQAILLGFILGEPVRIDDPQFAATRANAEPTVRDDPNVTLATLTDADVAGRDLTIAVGSRPNELISAAVDALTQLTGDAPFEVDADHEVHLTDPSVLTGVVTATEPQ